MARLVVKVKYLKPTQKQTPGKYAQYIGTRDGVAKIDDSAKYHDPRDRDTTYADYIATRPRAEKVGKHGLFTDAGVEVDLDKVSDELNNFKGTIWTVIVSIKREDAEMLGFDIGERWRNMVRANRDELAKNFKIRPSSLKWYGAFHNESYHPHIHLIIYDKDNRGYLDKDGIEKIKSAFAHVIFQDEMLNIQCDKTDRRDKLRLRGKDEIEAVINRINEGHENDSTLNSMLMELHRRLLKHKGKKVYGYLSKHDKELVNKIVDHIEKIPEIKELYELWYEKQEELRRMYSDTLIPRVPLSENPEFKTIRNAVVRAADNLVNQFPNSSTSSDDEEDIVGIDIDEDDFISTQKHLQNAACAIKQPVYEKPQDNPVYVSTAVTRLLNNVSRIFQDKFQDNPEHVSKVDIKLRRKLLEKDEAHGIKHG